jgi:hypothetical protein
VTLCGFDEIVTAAAALSLSLSCTSARGVREGERDEPTPPSTNNQRLEC